MSDPDAPVLHLIVSVNGAGKTTFYYRQLKLYLAERFADLPFVNADEIQRARGLTSDPLPAWATELYEDQLRDTGGKD